VRKVGNLKKRRDGNGYELSHTDQPLKKNGDRGERTRRARTHKSPRTNEKRVVSKRHEGGEVWGAGRSLAMKTSS